MTHELQYLALSATFTAVMWLPYILNALMVRGLREAVAYPECPKPLAPWAQRLKAAHYNAVENLVVFAALVLTAHAAGVLTDVTLLATTVYFWARMVHAVVYALAIPWLRTISFTVGWLCCMAIAVQLLR
jgi:uncharacterized MAPEG superfamily protein